MTITTARKTLTLAPVVHQVFDSHAAWEAAVVAAGMFLVRNAHQLNTTHDVPFPITVAYSKTGSTKIMGACFSEGIPFGWLRVASKD